MTEFLIILSAVLAIVLLVVLINNYIDTKEVKKWVRWYVDHLLKKGWIEVDDLPDALRDESNGDLSASRSRWLANVVREYVKVPKSVVEGTGTKKTTEQPVGDTVDKTTDNRDES